MNACAPSAWGAARGAGHCWGVLLSGGCVQRASVKCTTYGHSRGPAPRRVVRDCREGSTAYIHARRREDYEMAGRVPGWHAATRKEFYLILRTRRRWHPRCEAGVIITMIDARRSHLTKQGGRALPAVQWSARRRDGWAALSVGGDGRARPRPSRAGREGTRVQQHVHHSFGCTRKLCSEQQQPAAGAAAAVGALAVPAPDVGRGSSLPVQSVQSCGWGAQGCAPPHRSGGRKSRRVSRRGRCHAEGRSFCTRRLSYQRATWTRPVTMGQWYHTTLATRSKISVRVGHVGA